MDTTLWCVHSIGPDDIDAAPDFDTAEQWAISGNRQLREYTKDRGLENDPTWPICRVVVEVWPWSPKEHAKWLPEGMKMWAKTNERIGA